MQKIISVLFKSKSRALADISNALFIRGSRIISYSVGKTENPLISRATIITSGDAAQIIKRIERVKGVLSVVEITSQKAIILETALIRVDAKMAVRQKIYNIIKGIIGARVAHTDPRNNIIVIQITADKNKVGGLIKRLAHEDAAIEVVQCGAIAVSTEKRAKIVIESQEPEKEKGITKAKSKQALVAIEAP